ncbi:hypothetical protein [Kaistella jeonii]|uniref:Uncharacterized protein n=1 Tax=Kaistella jeonii TaxID=266749 RepID=A0A0C1FCS4_9FLAO|nr:hypothetical protein [Kaistella jeonii]KIA89603.1 hypothetical protein OA86_02930 [Kaistella jeonii]SFB90136.1 hypothetical protein SAMN05421876_103314 [Kaistella jeonii]VEI95813.1 Uncharacterised protein [Kaistella jeonii]
MRVYVEKEFMNHFVSLQNKRSKGIDILWSIIRDYAEVVWVFNEEVKYDDFERWEVTNSFITTVSSKGSNSIEFNKNFKQEIEQDTQSLQIILSNKMENWHKDSIPNLLVFYIEDFEKQLEDIVAKFSFRFIADENYHWNGIENLRSSLINEITITDKYIIDKFLQTKEIRNLDQNFIFLLRKIVENQSFRIKLYIKSKDADFGRLKELQEKLEIMSRHTKDSFSEKLSLQIINAELDADFDFHDRNIITNFYILKTGKGFERIKDKKVNTEVECYSFLEKWGYDLIRHRKKMMKEYEDLLINYPNTFSTLSF